MIIITMDTRGCEASVDVRAADIDPLDLPQPGTFVRCNKELARNYLWGKDFLKIAMQLGTSIAKTINSMTDDFVQSFSVQLTTILQENKKSIHSTILGELSSDYEYVVKEKDMYPDKTEQINYNKMMIFPRQHKGEIRGDAAMKASNFQFLNPYLEEMFFAGNDNFDMNEDIEMENSFNVQVKKDKENRRAKVELILETNVNVEDAPFRMRVKGCVRL